MKRILVISFTNIEKDVRILRHIKMLNSEFQVWTLGYGKKPDGSIKHFEIPTNKVYLPLTINSLLNVLLKKFSKGYVKTPAISWSIDQISLISNEIQAIFCNDVLTLGIPKLSDFHGFTIADMHEYAPKEMEDDWRFRLLLQSYYTYLCRNFLKLFDLITTVSPGLVAEYNEQFGVKCHLLLNAREHQHLPVNEASSNHLKVVHSGLATSHRRLDLMIVACSKLKNVSLDLFLVQAPRQKRTYKKLVKLALKTENCRVNKPVDPKELPKVLNKYDVGLSFIYPSSFSLRYGLGNKFFDYVQARLCLISGPSPDMANLINELKVGVVTEGFEADDLTQALKNLTPEAVAKYKENADKNAEKYSYENISLVFMDILKRTFNSSIY